MTRLSAQGRGLAWRVPEHVHAWLDSCNGNLLPDKDNAAAFKALCVQGECQYELRRLVRDQQRQGHTVEARPDQPRILPEAFPAFEELYGAVLEKFAVGADIEGNF